MAKITQNTDRSIADVQVLEFDFTGVFELDGTAAVAASSAMTKTTTFELVEMDGIDFQINISADPSTAVAGDWFPHVGRMHRQITVPIGMKIGIQDSTVYFLPSP